MRIKVLGLILAALFLIIIGVFYKQKALDFKFVDEQYNFAIGKYLTKGEKLYDDIITNHQPLTHILSFNIQQATTPPNIYQLVTKHRYALIIWATVWSLVLVYYFGFTALAFIVLYELTKIQLLGNLFLAESLIVYPLVFICGLTIFIKRQLRAFELFLWGVCFAISLFLLSPIWPFLIILLFLLIQKHLYRSLFALIGFLVVFLFILNFISVSGYLYYTIYVNLTYTVPAYQNQSWPIAFTKSFLTSFLSFLPSASTPTLWVIRILCLQFIFNTFSEKGKSFKKNLALILLLGFANIRYVAPGTEGYSGFHILPWYGLFIFIITMIIFQKRLFINSTIYFLVIILSLNFVKTSFAKSNQDQNYNINYSTHAALGEIIKSMKGENDTLFVSPDAWLIYWQSDIKHLPKLFGYYTWMVGLPALNKSILQRFENSPPTFLYCENCGGLALKKYLYKYKQLKRGEGDTLLFVLDEKVKQLTKKQRDQLANEGIGFN